MKGYYNIRKKQQGPLQCENCSDFVIRPLIGSGMCFQNQFIYIYISNVFNVHDTRDKSWKLGVNKSWSVYGTGICSNRGRQLHLISSFWLSKKCQSLLGFVAELDQTPRGGRSVKNCGHLRFYYRVCSDVWPEDLQELQYGLPLFSMAVLPLQFPLKLSLHRLLMFFQLLWCWQAHYKSFQVVRRGSVSAYFA